MIQSELIGRRTGTKSMIEVEKCRAHSGSRDIALLPSRVASCVWERKFKAQKLNFNSSQMNFAQTKLLSHPRWLTSRLKQKSIQRVNLNRPLLTGLIQADLCNEVFFFAVLIGIISAQYARICLKGLICVFQFGRYVGLH